MGLAAGAVAELVDGGVGAVTAGFGGAVASVGRGLAFATVINHTLDDGLAKAHDIIVVDALIIIFIATASGLSATRCAES